MTKDQEKSSSLKVLDQRRSTLKKKAETLSTLCNDVCLLCFGPAGDFDSFPEDPSKVRQIIERFQEASRRRGSNKRFGKRKLGLSDVLGSQISTLQKQLGDETLDKASDDVDQLSLSRWNEQLDFLDSESLGAVAGCLESKIQAIDSRIGFLNVRKHYLQPPNGFSLQPPNGFSLQPPNSFSLQPPNGYSLQPTYGFSLQPPYGFSLQQPNSLSLPSNSFSLQQPYGFSLQQPNSFSLAPNRFSLPHPNSFSLPSGGSGVSQWPMVVKTNPNYFRDTY